MTGRWQGRGWKYGVVMGTCVALSVAAVTLVSAQSGTRSGSGMQRQAPARPAPRPSFEQRLWDHLQAVRYDNWAPLPTAVADFYPAEGPHGAFVKLYANRTAVATPQDLPVGSMIVKENYARDRTTLMAITVMYRAKDYDPEHNDWYWVKYEPNGQAAQMNGMPVAGRAQMCIDCHSQAGGDDFVFAND